MDSIRVETATLRRTAAAYDQQASRLAQAIPHFRSRARAHDDAFGVLGEARDVHASYLRSVDEAVKFLNGAVEELRRRAGKFRAMAATYDLADQA
jgi:uncharacterized protein YukE